MVTLRGRAATPVRPGLTIKGVLSGQVPLRTGNLVTEAAITDIHGAYKEQIRRENSTRPKIKRLRGMTYRSFITLFRFADLLGLVELSREEPMLFPPPHGHLYSIRRHDGVHFVTSVRRIYKLTDNGKEDELSWTNLCKAWIENWPVPQKLAVPVGPLAPIEAVVTKKPGIRRKPPTAAPPEVPPEVPLAVRPMRWVSRPSDRQVALLLDHLETLNEIGIEDLEVKREVNRLSELIRDWVTVAEEWLDDARTINFAQGVMQFTEMLAVINNVSKALRGLDLPGAIEELKKLVK